MGKPTEAQNYGKPEAFWDRVMSCPKAFGDRVMPYTKVFGNRIMPYRESQHVSIRLVDVTVFQVHPK